MYKRGLSAILAVAMTISVLPPLPASALENDEPFPYTLFADSAKDGAITINADNVCLNGSVVTNGSIETTASNFNVNGQRIEHAQHAMVYAFGKLDEAYFDSDNVLTYESDYVVENVNISPNTPIVSAGSISMKGNINLNTQLKAEEDILISGGSCNANNAALISHHGDIYIESTNFGFAGLIYAPHGDIVIDSSSMSLNNVVVIGQTITIDTLDLNVNHNPNAANVIGTISEESNDQHNDADNYFYAIGAYSEETSTINIAWSGSDLPVAVDILASTDGENYSSVATITDATSYAYPVEDDFVSTYFKVSYTDAKGNAVESIPFRAVVTDDGIKIDYPDSDDDGIVDLLESILGTAPDKKDTDEDGLTDSQELNITGTSPTEYDSVQKRISDADADSDDDGISNIVEIGLGTDPQIRDSDNDGLADGEEVNTYLIDPLLEDSDGDSLTDGFEVRYGLDPLLSYTDGIADAERKIEQSISAESPVFRKVNISDSPYEMSISIRTNGDAERGMAISESGYSASLENDAQIGNINDIVLSDACEPETIRLEYAIKEDYRSNTLNKYTEYEDMQGIRRLCVFKYYDEIGMMLPLETQYDLENNIVYADVDSMGTYSVMDLEKWFDMFGITSQNLRNNTEKPNNTGDGWWSYDTLQAETEQPGQMFSKQYNTAASVQTTEAFGETVTFNGSRYELFDEDLTWKDAKAFCESRGGHLAVITSADELNAIKTMISNHGTSEVYWIGGTDEQTEGEWNWITDETFAFTNWCENGPNNYTGDNKNGEDYLGMMRVQTSWANPYEWNDFTNETTLSSGFLCEWEDYTPSEYTAIVGLNYKKVTLLGPITKNGATDSDSDTLTDWQEIDTRYIKVAANGSITLPTVQYLISHAEINIDNILNFAGNNSAARDAMFRAVLKCQVLPCLSDPTLKDTDSDSLNDNIDNLPLIKADNRFSLCSSSDYEVMPENTFVNERWCQSNDEYNTLVKEEIANRINNLYSYPIRGLTALLTLLFTDTKGCAADFGISILTSHLCSSTLAFLSDTSFENAGYLSLAPEALEHYFLGTGTGVHYSQEDICDLILSSQNNIDHLIYNITKSMQFAEHVAQYDRNVYFSTTPDANLKLSCYDDKGQNCVFGLYQIQPNGHRSGKYNNSRHVDWHNTVGESFCGISACVSYQNGVYKMKYRYYLNDIYEWVNIGRFDDIGTVLHFFHEMGYAKQYLIDGFFEGEITWKEGDSALDKDVYDSIMNTMHEIQGFYAYLYDESDEYYEKSQVFPFDYRKVN